MAAFVPLRIFSAYTMLEGAIDPKEVATRARALGFPAAAITDRNGLYGAMAYGEAAKKAGVQPIIGALLGVARPGTAEGKPVTVDWLALYAQDEAGYDNLCRLVSAAHLDRPAHEDAHVPLAGLEGRVAGLLALTGAGDGALVRLLAEEQAEAAHAYLDRLEVLFPGRLYIELARRGLVEEERAEAGLIDLAYARGLPLVATNPACFAEPDFHAAHDTMLCIAGSAYVDSTERTCSSPDAWMKPAAAMVELFADLPEAIANTLVVAQRCAVAAPARKPILPSLAGDPAAEAEALRRDARAGLEERLARLTPSLRLRGEGRGEGESTPSASLIECDSPSPNPLPQGGEGFGPYRARLEFELDVITQMGFAGYFLIVADFIKWAKEQGIPVGPGRGSGAGSVVSWALTITDLDPLALGLLFERFLNPERVSMPDFDIDFCETRRGEVISYVQAKYGRAQVAQIITFGRLKARAVLKDTGRVLQMSYGQVDRLAKLVPNHPVDPWTLGRALNGVSELAAEYKQDRQVKRLFDLAMKLEGLPRHSSTHAAGVVIGDRPLSDLVPLYRDPRSDMPVTQFDLKYVESAGLVKFDFLGLKTLSVLRKAVEMLRAKGVEVDLDTLAWDDPAVYALLSRGDTVGVFQFESEGMRRMLGSVRPSAFGDIVALGALYRPGPMDNIPMFAARKNGREPIENPHPVLAEILAETYGIFVYQEQVMQAAQILAGYSLGQADLLRRAMGKKIASEMAAQRQDFVDGCLAVNGIDARKANELFDLIDKFAGYGFNKSHAAAYAVLSYQTAWVKAHHKAEFYAASMCYDMGLTDKLAIWAEDMRRAGVELLPPDVNRSAAEFVVEANGSVAAPPVRAEPVEAPSFSLAGMEEKNGPSTSSGRTAGGVLMSGQSSSGREAAVRYALGALKGVGEKAMEALVEERAKAPFASLDDFAERIDPRLLNRRQIESLAAAGAFDALAPARAAVFAAAETILAEAATAHEQRETGQGGLFGNAGEAAHAHIRLAADARWSVAERMAAEKEAFGFYFSAHPTDRYRHVAAGEGARGFAQLCAMGPGAEAERDERGQRVPRPAMKMAALVEEAKWRTSARGTRYLIATCSDASGQYVASAFDEAPAAELEKAVRTGACLLLTVELDRRPGEETPRVTVRSARPLDGPASNARLRMEVEVVDEAALAPLAALLGMAGGARCEVVLTVPAGAHPAHLHLGRAFRLDAELADQVERLAGVVAVRLEPVQQPELRLVS